MKLWAAFSGVTWKRPLAYARLSNKPGWTQFSDSLTEATLRAQLEESGGTQSNLKVELVSSRTLPRSSFEFRNTGMALGMPRASYIRFSLPNETEPEKLLELVREIAECLPIWHGSAGYVFNVFEEERAVAYDQVWAWARRFWGVQVADPITATWDAINGLLGVNWLNILGHTFLTEAFPAALNIEELYRFEVEKYHHATILKTGRRPVVGDLNVFEDLAPYALASHALAPMFVADPIDFPGMFTDHKSTLKWVNRFEHSAGWLDPELAI